MLLQVLASIRTRLTALVVLALIPALALFVADYQEHRQHEAFEARTRAMQASDLVAGEQQEALAGARVLVATLARVPAIRAGDPRVCRPLLADMLARDAAYADLALARPDGSILCTGAQQAPTASVARRAWFQSVLGSRRPTVGQYEVDGVRGHPRVTVACPVFGPAQDVRLVLYASLDLARLAPAAAHARLPEGSSVMLADRDGDVITSYRGTEHWGGPTGALAPAVAALVASRLAATTEAADASGVPRLWAVAPVRVAGEAVAHSIVGVPAVVAYGHIEATRHRTLALLLLAVALTVVLVWAGSDLLILRRLKALLSATERLTAGDLGARSGLPRGSDELARLAVSFDEMAATLQQTSGRLRGSLEETRGLVRHLQSVREQERSRVAREVDDEVGQSLSALRMGHARLRSRLRRVDHPEAAKALAEVESLHDVTGAAIEAVRRIATDLRPAVLDALGLVAAIEWQARDFEGRTRIACDFATDAEDVPLERTASTALFRVLEEALANVERHARATRVTVRLMAEPGAVRLCVEDNGVGIEPETASAGVALGLLGMRERVLALGGEFDVSGEPGEGTRVLVMVPRPCPEPGGGAVVTEASGVGEIET